MSLVEEAQRLFDAGRYGAASTACEALIARSQEHSDRASEVVARSLLARCLLKRGRAPEAAEHLDVAARHVDPLHLQSYGTYRAALVRLAAHRFSGEQALAEMRDYLAWAQAEGHVPSVLDACELLAADADAEGKVHWYERAVDTARLHGYSGSLAPFYQGLGSSYDALDLREQAQRAYEDALAEQRRYGSPESVALACWAVGHCAIRSDDWPHARTLLEEAVALGDTHEAVGDVLALALADLGRVNEAAGDVIEARRLVIRAARVGREHGLPSYAPRRWRAIIDYGTHLELEL